MHALSWTKTSFSMKKILPVFICIALCSFTADAETQCMLDLNEITSFIDSSSSEISVLAPATLTHAKRELTHKIKLRNGAEVGLSMGGCVHYGYTLTFTHVPNLHAKLDKENLAIVKENIQLLPLVKDSGFAYVKGHILSEDWRPDSKFQCQNGPCVLFKCGDATCDLEVGEQIFIIGYDFPL